MAEAIGVNWGTMASHPLPPPKVVELLKSNNINKVKLFDADPLVLQALSGSNIGVTVGIPNTMLRSLNSSKKAAESWVHDNVTRYISNGGSRVRIEYVLSLFRLCLSVAFLTMSLIGYCFKISGSWFLFSSSVLEMSMKIDLKLSRFFFISPLWNYMCLTIYCYCHC